MIGSIDAGVVATHMTRRSASRSAAWLAALVACAHSGPRTGPGTGDDPSADTGAETRAEIDQAEAAEAARRHDVARAHYERAIAVARDPQSAARARHEYAETLVTWGEPHAARAQLELAVSARPQDAAAWHDLGLVRHATGDDAGAIQALARAEHLAPHDIRPRTALAALYWQRGDRASAAREYRAMLALDLPARLRAKVEWALAELAKP